MDRRAATALPPDFPSRDRLHLRLLARIHRRYQTTTEHVELAGLRFPFTRIADPDKVLDQVAEEVDRQERASGKRQQEPLHLPYWAELWDSAAGVAQWLAQTWGNMPGEEARETAGERGNGKDCQSSDEVSPGATGARPHPVNAPAPPLLPIPTVPLILSASPRVLDLGCGMGLAGTVAAALGARVLFADLEAPALLFARLNSLPSRPRVRTRRLNWQFDRLGERFDLIVGADILYERKQWEYLEPFWRAHLEAGASVLLGEPGRQTGDAFGAWIESRGWQVELFEQPVNTRPKPIRIFRIRR